MALGPIEMVFVLLLWTLPFVLLAWLIRTLRSMKASLKSIERRLDAMQSTADSRRV